MSTSGIAQKVLKIEDDLVSKLDGLKKKINKHTGGFVNPLEKYAEPHKEYVTKYCNGTKKVLFLGMNPGKCEMAKGIPFGDVEKVRDWLKIESMGQVAGNGNEDLSGTRFWSLIEEEFGKPEAFFNNCFVYNYCPFLFKDNNSYNLSLEKLMDEESPAKEHLAALEEYCDNALKEIIKLLKIETVVGIGRYAQERANEVKNALQGKNVRVVYMLHPSPMTGSDCNEWKDEARKTIREYLPWIIPAESQ